MSELGSDRHDRPLVPPVSDKGSGTPSDPSSAAYCECGHAHDKNGCVEFPHNCACTWREAHPSLAQEIHAALVEDRVGENLTETFNNMRGSIDLYERGEVSFKSLLRSLRVSMTVLDAKEVKRG